MSEVTHTLPCLVGRMNESKSQLSPTSHETVNIKFYVKQNVAASQQTQHSFIYSLLMCTLGMETDGFDGLTQPVAYKQCQSKQLLMVLFLILLSSEEHKELLKGSYLTS